MKNFRKVLALVLVVATLFSFVAMTASAKEYTDADKVSYTEAVDVLTAIGILNGYTDGTYRPTNTIARAEMAKMIAVLANAGKDNIGDLYASACKFADMTGDAVWAKSYVAYCNQIGIVAGRNATTFDPYGKVTGVETAKMLLCMIGFDAKAQGYVGTNWQVNVMRDAEKLGLLEGFAADYKIEKAITREEAAQMMLNALLAPMVVGTVSDNIVNISNAVWLNANGIKGVTITLTDAVTVYGCYVLYGNVLVSNVPVWTNFGGLDVTDAQDCYGNPVTKWSFTNEYGKEIWSAEYAHAYDFYYTDKATIKTDLDKLGSVNSYKLYEDGKQTRYYTNTVDNKTAFYDAVVAASGKGVETKVYLLKTIVPPVDNKSSATVKVDVIVTVKNTYIGVVDYVNKAAGTFTLNNNLTFSNAGYGFAEDDVVLYWLCSGNQTLHDAEVATPVNADVTRTYVATAGQNDSYIVASGKTYNYAENLGNYVVSTGLKATLMGETENKEKGNYDLYLDKFGYIMAWVYAPEATEHGYIYLEEGSGLIHYDNWTSGGKYTYTATATTVDFDAKVTANDAIDEDAFDALKNTETGSKHGVLIKYAVNGERKDHVQTATPVRNDNRYIAKETGDLCTADGTTIFAADENTKYLVRTYDFGAADYKYTAYTWKTLPYNFCGKLANVTDNSVVANIQYFTEKNTVGKDVLTYVFVNALYTNSTPVNAFVIGKTANISDDLYVDVIGDYEAYDAVIGGKRAILAVTDDNRAKIAAGAWLNKAELTVIDLLDDNVPVYATVKEVQASTDFSTDNAWYYEGGKIWLYGNATNNLKGSYTVAEGFFAVVAHEKADGTGYDYELITDPAKINDYVEVKDGVVNVKIPAGYSSARSWAVDNNGAMTELYIVVDRNPKA